MELDNFEIKDKYDKPFTMALIGSTKSGKSTFLNYLIPKIHKKFDLIFLFSSNVHCNVYDPIKNLDNVVAMSEFQAGFINDIYKINKKTENFFRLLVLMDDEINNKNSKILKNLFSTLRNSNFSTIFSGQDYTFIAKSSRNNINYVFIFKQNSMDANESILKTFLSGAIELPEELKRKPKYIQHDYKRKFLLENTQNYNIIVLDILNGYKIYKFKTPI